MSEPRKQVHTRLPERVIKAIDHWAVDHECNRDRATQILLEFALDLHYTNFQKGYGSQGEVTHE